MVRVKFSFESGIEIIGEINEDLNPRTAKKIIEVLPIRSKVRRWGDEIYFETPVDIELEKSQEYVELGAIGYWPLGKALCLFFGKTPVSDDERPKAYSPVNVIGKLHVDLTILRKVRDGETVKVEISDK